MLAVLLLSFVGTGGSVASADSKSNGKSGSGANSVSATVKYCKSKVPDKLQSECTTDNMNALRQAVSPQCDGKSNKNGCIENLAEDAVDQIVKKNPKNKHDFEAALNAVVAASTASSYDPSSEPTPTGAGKNCDNNNCDLIALYVNPFIRILTVIVGLVITASLIGAGVQYSVSSGDPQKTSAAKSRISNTLLAFFLYAFLYAFLNFLIPGGIF